MKIHPFDSQEGALEEAASRGMEDFFLLFLLDESRWLLFKKHLFDSVGRLDLPKPLVDAIVDRGMLVHQKKKRINFQFSCLDSNLFRAEVSFQDKLLFILRIYQSGHTEFEMETGNVSLITKEEKERIVFCLKSRAAQHFKTNFCFV